MATARLDLRLDEDIKARAEKATALLGYKSLTDYLVNLMDKDAAQVIAEHENIVLEKNIFDRFTTACEAAAKPNDALLAALKLTQSKGL